MALAHCSWPVAFQGDILDCQQNELYSLALVEETASVEAELAPPHFRKTGFDLKILYLLAERQNFFQQLAQRRHVPLSFAGLVDHFTNHMRRAASESGAKRFVGVAHPQVRAEQQQRRADQV